VVADLVGGRVETVFAGVYIHRIELLSQRNRATILNNRRSVSTGGFDWALGRFFVGARHAGEWVTHHVARMAGSYMLLISEDAFGQRRVACFCVGPAGLFLAASS
jgi:hypothetical protein